MPHPRFRERFFVLGPLAEIAPDMRDPVTGLTVTELLRALLRDEIAVAESADRGTANRNEHEKKGRENLPGPFSCTPSSHYFL